MLIAASFEFFNKLHAFFRLYPTGTERVELRLRHGCMAHVAGYGANSVL